MKSTLYMELKFKNRHYLFDCRHCTTEHTVGYYHFHHGLELLLVHQGIGSVIVNQKTYELRPGMLFFFRPLQLHKVYIESSESNPYERSVFHFQPQLMEAYLAAFPTLRDLYTRMKEGFIIEQGFEVSAYKEELEQASEIFQDGREAASTSGGGEEQAALYLLHILSVLQRSGLAEDRREAVKQLRHSDQVLQWIESHYQEPFRMDKLANELHLSKSYLSRLFKEETGSSITGYLIARRIRQACSLLHSSEQSIELIGEQVGLSNVSYFIQLFKKVMGISPHQYRLKL
ncbi:AraC family transcriptional regulator [Paenibacillus sp. HB172176]|uniref:AraC family transcriptional regulator n=1 Tax=Paenibacillus sp. HB172176 TaxID=2493690 RepID=UPI0014392F17|nr:AraC family transcriptional regulator [Paenibacillus sp. HB172176]